MEKQSEKNNGLAYIHYSHILILVIGILLGVIILQLAHNYLGGENITLSTIDILGFFFGTALSATSIILSITAIMLGKLSENTITNLAERSSNALAKMIARHRDILSRLETSSGINEKRIEDIVHQIALLPHLAEKDREDAIRKILSKNKSNSESDDGFDDEYLEKLEEKFKNKQLFESNVTANLSNIEDVSTLKLGSGDMKESGYDLVDGVFKLNELTFTVSIFYFTGKTVFEGYREGMFKDYLLALANSIGNKSFNKCFLVFNIDYSKDEKFINEFESFSKIANAEMVNNIHLISGDAKTAVEQVKNTLNQPTLGVTAT